MKWLTVLTVIVFGAAAANADTLTYYVDIFGGCTANGGGCPGTSPTGSSTASTTPILLSSAILEAAGTQNTVTTPEFDTALGTLDSVTITLETEFVGGLQVFNISGVAHDFTGGFANIPLTVSGSSLPTVSGTPGVTGLSGTVQPGIGNPYVSPSDTYTASNSTGLLTTGLSAFEGLGDFSYNVCQVAADCSASNGATQVGGNGALFNGTYGNAGGILEVTYDYSTGTPEPASFFVVGAALLGGGFAWRRRTGRKG